MRHGFVGLRVKHLKMDEQERVFNSEDLGFRIQLIVVLVGGVGPEDSRSQSDNLDYSPKRLGLGWVSVLLLLAQPGGLKKASK